MNSCQFVLLISLGWMAGTSCRHATESNPRPQTEKGIGDASHRIGKSESPVFQGVVSGDSMAPSLMGEHFLADCPDCRFPIHFQSKGGQKKTRVVCPNCGDDSLHGRIQKVAPARVKIYAPPKSYERWQIVAIEQKDGSHQIKRVVGLPGELLEFRGGDLFVDSQTKVLPWMRQFSSIRIPVYDSRYTSIESPRLFSRPSPSSPLALPFLISNSDSLQTIPIDSKPRPSGPPDQKGDSKMYYRHLACYRSAKNRQPEAIRDSLGYNQQVTRSLNVVDDIGTMIGFEGVDHIEFRCHLQTPRYPSVSIDLEISPTSVTATPVDGVLPPFQKYMRRQESDFPIGKNPQVWVGMVDGKLRVGVNRRLLIEYSLIEMKTPDVDQKTDQAEGPLSVPHEYPVFLTRIQGKRGKITRIRVFRDLFYFKKSREKIARLANDELFVIGDNLPVSRDSRHWAKPIKIQQVIGVVRDESEW